MAERKKAARKEREPKQTTCIQPSALNCATDNGGAPYVTALPYGFVLFSIVLLVFCGCATRVAPGAETIIVTRNASDVEGCIPVGNVEAHPPYHARNDDLRQLRNQALPMGATAIFITHRGSKVTGVAYRCEEK